MLFVPFGDMFGFCGIGACAIGAAVDGAPMYFGTAPSPGTDGIGAALTDAVATVNVANVSAAHDTAARTRRRVRRFRVATTIGTTMATT